MKVTENHLLAISTLIIDDFLALRSPLNVLSRTENLFSACCRFPDFSLSNRGKADRKITCSESHIILSHWHLITRLTLRENTRQYNPSGDLPCLLNEDRGPTGSSCVLKRTSANVYPGFMIRTYTDFLVPRFRTVPLPPVRHSP